MLPTGRINEIAREVLQANTSPHGILNVSTQPAADAEGEEVLRISVVVSPEAVDKLRQGAVLDSLVQILDRLRESGEQRFPLIEYATEDELEHLGDPES